MSTTSKRVGWAVLPIDPAIAALAQSARFAHGDPADRIIGATALRRNPQLISADSRLQNVKGLKVIW
jgi:PIN domain nuclease of toxin-antitoxin system